MIVFKGHPAVRKLEDDINKLLKGEKLTGDGIANGDSEENEDPAYKELDHSKIERDY
jgi:hypothetical protein